MAQKTEQFNKKGTLKRYGYRSSEFHSRSFHLTKRDDEKQKSEPIGDYIILKTDEAEDISLKKVENLIQVLNEEKPSRLKEFNDAQTFFERISNEALEDSEDEDDESQTSSGSGGYIMRTLYKEGVTLPEARIVIADDEALRIFESKLNEYCESLSSDGEYRNRAFYALPSEENPQTAPQPRQ